jgi:hypothetical protein
MKVSSNVKMKRPAPGPSASQAQKETTAKGKWIADKDAAKVATGGYRGPTAPPKGASPKGTGPMDVGSKKTVVVKRRKFIRDDS